MTLDVDQLDQALLFGAGVLLLAILAVRLSVRMGLPSLLVYLLMGVLLGKGGLGVQFSDAELAHSLGFLALIVILAEGGLTTSWPEIRPVMRFGVSLATLGIAVSVAVVAVLAHVVIGLDWQLAVLLGAITSATDSAAVFSVLRRVPLPRRLSGPLEAESGLNDAPTVVLVTLVSAGGQHSLPMFIGEIAFELVVGVLVGRLVGVAAAWLLRRVALPSSGLYPVSVMTFAILAYAGAATLHGSGFAAVYVAALILGNAELPHRMPTRSFAEGLAWLAQIGLFVMLGLLVTPDRLGWETLGVAAVAAAALKFVARPLSVLTSSVVQPMSLRDLSFVSYAGLRGAVPIVFATIPLSYGVAGASRLFDVVFMMVVLSTLVTGPTLPWVARRLGVVSRSEPRELDVEAAPLERIAADLLQVTISPESRLHGVEVGELRLPKGASVALIVRDGQTRVPELRTVLRRGDDVLVVTPRKQRAATEKRLGEISLGGRLAYWLGEVRQP